jgi:hypothetical protein
MTHEVIAVKPFKYVNLYLIIPEYGKLNKKYPCKIAKRNIKKSIDLCWINYFLVNLRFKNI